MGTNLTKVDRASERSIGIVDAADKTAVVAVAPVVRESVSDFQQTDETVNLIVTEERKAREEKKEKLALFAREFDQTCSSILVRMPYAELPLRASRMATDDDLLNGGRKVQSLLTKVGGVDETHPLDGEGESAPKGEQWAIDIGRPFSDHLAVATAQVNTAVALSERLQRAIENRAQKRALLERRLVMFRRLVRDVYGAGSREYRRLKDRNQSTNDEDDAPVVNPPATEPVPA